MFSQGLLLYCALSILIYYEVRISLLRCATFTYTKFRCRVEITIEIYMASD